MTDSSSEFRLVLSMLYIKMQSTVLAFLWVFSSAIIEVSGTQTVMMLCKGAASMCTSTSFR